MIPVVLLIWAALASLLLAWNAGAHRKDDDR